MYVDLVVDQRGELVAAQSEPQVHVGGLVNNVGLAGVHCLQKLSGVALQLEPDQFLVVLEDLHVRVAPPGTLDVQGGLVDGKRGALLADHFLVSPGGLDYGNCFGVDVVLCEDVTGTDLVGLPGRLDGCCAEVLVV